MRVFIYCRVSTDDQEDNTSLEQQEIDDREYCEKNGLIVVDVIKEVFTGSVWRERKQFMQMRVRYLHGEADGVVVRTYSRLTRIIADYFVLTQEMLKHNVILYCVKEYYENNPMGKMLQALQMGFNEQERETIRQRMIDGKRARVVNRGEYLAAKKSPYGFNFNDPVKKSKLEANEGEADIVRWIFEQRAYNNGTYIGLALLLNERSVPSPGGKKWHQSSIRRIIENGKYLYRGVGVAFKGKDIREYRGGRLMHVRLLNPEEDFVFLPEGTVPRIIEDELAFKALAVGEVNKQDNPRANSTPEATLLRGGFVKCGACGHTMTAINGSTKKHSHYQCGASRKAHKPCTSHTSIIAPTLDREVWDYAVEVAKNLNTLELAVSKVMDSDMLESAEQSILQCIRECDDLIAQYRKDLKSREWNPATRAVLLEELENQVERNVQFEEQLEKIRLGRMDYEQIREEFQRLVSWCEKVRSGTDTPLSWEQKRSHLRILGIQAVVYPEKDTVHERIEILMAPKGLMDVLKGKLYDTH